MADIEGTVEVDVAGFVSLSGSFGFQSYAVGSDHYLAIGATGLTATLTADSVSLNIANAQVGVIVKEGSPSTYVLEARGSSNPADTALTGVPGLTLSATNLLVRVRSGLDVSDLPSGLPASVQTPGGAVTFDFSGLGTGTSNVTDIEGHLTLAVAGLASLEGDFGFQAFADGSASDLAIGANNVNVVLGTASTNVTITGASLGLLVKSGVGYALVANGGTDTLNGVPGLSISSTGLSVRVRSGLDPSTLTGAPTSVQTAGGGSVPLDFSNLGSSNVTEVAGSISINVANLVSLIGKFSFTETTTGSLTKILVGASGVSAFLGSVDSSGNPTLGVQVTGASFGLVIYRDSTATSSTYALQATAPSATAPSIALVGLPDNISLTGSASVAINTTGAAVNETIPNSPGVTFTDGTNGTADQRNIKSLGGHLSLVVGPQSSPYFSLAGDFSISELVSGTETKVLIGAANLTANSPVMADGGTDTFNLSNGTLGLVLFQSGGTNEGYALTASATATVAVGSALSGSATLTIRRNTTTSAVNETIAVGASTVAVVFSDSEVATVADASGSDAFQAIVLSNASLNLDNTLVITASEGSNSVPVPNASSINLAGVTLTLQIPADQTTGQPAQVLLNIGAGSAVYTSFSDTVSASNATSAGLPARADGQSWGSGDKDLVLSNVTFSIGSFVTFSATSINVQHYTYTDASLATVTVNSFNFSGAKITFLANANPMVTLTGSPQFHYSTAEGFKLDSFGSPGISFLDPSYSLGPITVKDPSVSLDSFDFNFASTSSSPGNVNVSAVVHVKAAAASIGSDTSPINASLTNLDIKFTVSAGFDLLHPLALPTISANGFTVQVNTCAINIGTTSDGFSLSLTAGTSANPLVINPTAGAGQDLISFGTLTATLNISAINLKLTGSASNFAIEGDGSFLAKPGFAISITLGASDASSFSWPSWLPLQSASVTLSWPDFNAHPDRFLIELSATINASLGPISLNGSITNAVIDPQLIVQGKFPIISVDSIAVGVSGDLFGGSLSGTLLAGVVRFDANGNVVDGLGNLVGPKGATTTTPGTGPFTSAFYAGIAGSLDLGGQFGMAIRIGLSDFGPLQLYVEVDTPIPLGDTGLFIGGLRGGITFGATFPTLNLTGSPSDALQLRQPGFRTPDSLTAAQWEAQLRTQVANLYHAGATPGSGWSSLTSASVIIQAGVTIYAANADVFRVDGDVFLDTSGKFLVIGSATFGDSLSVGVKMYTDLSPLFRGQPSISILFLMEVPSQSSPKPITPPIYSLYGEVSFAYANQAFQMTIAGAADLNVLGALQAHAEGTLTLTFTSNSFTVTLSNASFSIPTIQKDPLGEAAGTLTIQTLNGSVNIWGGFLLVPDLKCLEDAGIYAGGQVFIKLNTTGDLKQVTLQMTNGPYTLSLEPQSFSLFINGYADFQISGHEVFRLSGTLDMAITTDHLSIFVQAQLFLGGSVDSQGNLSNAILTFNANGLIYVQWAAANGINAGFAAKMTLTLGANGPPGISFGMNWLLVINTTGSDLTYFIPVPLPTSPPSPPVPTVMGPDYSSSNPSALTSYEITSNGQRTLFIPNGPPANGLASYATWTPVLPNTAYFIVIGRGSVTLSNYFVLTGAVNITATLGASGFDFSLQANATLKVLLNGNAVLSFQAIGALQLSNAGVAAALSISYSEGFPGFSLNAAFLLELNTTGAPVTLIGITLPVGIARIRATGDLKVLGGVVDLNGTFDITVTASALTLAVNANLTFLNATFHASGFAGIYYDSNPGLALRIQLSLPGGAQGFAPVAALGNKFVISGAFTLELNTTNVTRYDQNNSAISPGFRVTVSNLGVYLFGFNLAGSLSIGISSAGFSINISYLTLNLFGLATATLSGYYHPNGSFSFTGSAGFQLGDHVFGIGGSISVTISNSGFSASVNGWVAAFGVQISGGGAIVISRGSVDISVYIYVVLIPAIHIHTPAVRVWGITIWPAINIDIPAVTVGGTAHFHLGSTSPAPTVAQVIAAPPAAAPPVLAGVTSGQLVLYLGQDVNNRVNSLGQVTGAQPAENYTLTRVPGDTGTTNGGETIQVAALGYTQNYPNVTSILVRNTLDGNDVILMDNGIAVPVNITLGTGNSSISTGAGVATVNVTGGGDNQVTTGDNANVTIAGNGSNEVSTGSGSMISVSGSGSNRLITNGGSAPITISGAGNNGVTINGAYSGTFTLTSAASGNNSLDITGGSPTIYVNGGGDNEISVSSDSSRTISVSGNGDNVISSAGSGSTTVTISGDGDNRVTIGGGASIISVTGNGANQIATGGGAATVTLLGSGDNQVTTAGGFATINDEGTGGNTILGGLGGGVYIGGLDPYGSPFAAKGDSSVSTSYGNFSVRVSGYSSYTLADYGLSYGSFSLSLSGVGSAILSAGSSATANQFSLAGWSGSATLNGQGTSNALLYVPADSMSGLNYVLTNSSLQVTGGLTQTIALSNIQTANLVGANAGTNTYDVSGWTGGGGLDGPAGATNTVKATDDVNFAVSDTTLSRTGFTDLTLLGIQNAVLAGGASSNTFTASNWSGSATFDGAGGSDTYNLTLSGSGTGIFAVADSGPAAGDTLNITCGRTTFVTSAQVKVGTQHVSYSGIAILNVNGSVGGLTYNVQSTSASVTTTVGTTGSSNVINVGSTAGLLPTTPGVVNNIAGTLNLVGGGQDTLNVDDTASSTAKTGTLTPTALIGLGMGASGINYQGLSALNLQLGSGGNTFNIHDINTATHTTVNGGSSNNDTVNATFAADFNGRLDLTAFEHGSVSVVGNFNGAMTDTGPGHLESVQLGQSLAASGTLTAGGIDSMNVGLDVVGTVTVSGALTNLAVAGNLSGSVTETGVVAQLTITGSFTAAGTITVSNASPALADITTMSVGRNLAGTLLVTGNVTTLNVGSGATDALSGSVTVNATLITLSVTGDVSGKVTESGTINLLTIGGSLTATGVITAFNTADSTQVPLPDPTTLGNINTFTVGHDLAGKVILSGDLGTLTVGGNLSGTVTVQDTLTTMAVTGDVSGTVTESGTINSLTIGGSLTATGVITAFNTADSTQVPLPDPTTLGNINTFTIGHDLAGKVFVSGNLATLTVGGNLSGTVTVQDTLTTLAVTGDVSGTVTEFGTITSLTIGGSLTATGVITAANTADPAQVPGPTSGNINTMTVGHDLFGVLTVTGNVTTLNVGSGATDALSGGVTVNGTLTTLSVTGDVSGKVTESGTLNLLTIGGSLTANGIITAANTADPAQVPGAALGNINTFNIVDDLAGKVTVTGNLITLTVGSLPVLGNLSGTVSVHNTLTTVKVTANVSGTVTESGTINLLTIGGSLTASGVITAFNTADPTRVPSPDPTTLGNINTFTIGHDLAGKVFVSGNLATLTVGGNLSGTVTVQDTLTTLAVTGDVSGTVTESGTITSLTIGGSLTLGATITASNLPHDPSQLPLAGGSTLANITKMSVGQDLAGTLLVTGNVTTLSVGSGRTDALSGGVTVNGTLTTLSVTGDVSGSVFETGTINSLSITGSLTSTGTITAKNTQDSPQVPVSGPVTLANINTFSMGHDLAGTVTVTGNLGTLPNNLGGMTVGTTAADSLGGTVAVGNTLTNLTVTGDVSGRVTESGTINLLTIGGSLTANGIITAANTADPAQVPGAALGNINTFNIVDDLAGKATVTGNLITLTVGSLPVLGNLSGTVSVHNTLTTVKVTADVSGTVTESGTINLLTIGGSLTASGVITAFNTADPTRVPSPDPTTLGNINTFTIGHDLAGKVFVSGNLATLTVGGNLSGTVTVQDTLTTLAVTGDVSGTVTESGTITSLTIGGSLTLGATITASNLPHDPSQLPLAGGSTLANITKMSVGQDLAGTLLVTGNVTTLSVGSGRTDALSGGVTVNGTLTTLSVAGDVSGSVFETGTINSLSITGSLTSTGTITAKNTQDSPQVPVSGPVTLANINTFSMGHDLAGTVTVTGNLGTLPNNLGGMTVGTTAADSLGGTVAVGNTLTNLTVTGDVSGRVTESGTINLLTIGGSLTANGIITAANTADPAQVPGAALGNINTFNIVDDLAGKATVTGNLIALTVGGNLSGTVTVQNTLTNLAVTGDVSGTVTESGTINLLTIGGSLTATGVITAFNTADSTQVPLPDPTTLGNINTFTIGHDLAGKVILSGDLSTLTVGGNLSGTVTVQDTLTTLAVTGDVSGTVTESGTINSLTIGGSLTATGVITAFNTADPTQVPSPDPTTLANINRFTIGHDLAGKVIVSGNLVTLTVGGNLSGTVTVQNTLTTLAVTGDVSGTVTETGTVSLLAIGGSLTQTGLIQAVNRIPTLGNINSMSVGQNFAGTLIVSGTLGSLAIVNGSMTPTASLTVGALGATTIGPNYLSVGQNMAGRITVLGTLQSLRVAGGTPGSIIAGHVGTISVYGGFGPVVLNVTENGIQRLVEATTPSTPYPLPNPYSAALAPGQTGYVNFQFYYDSGSLPNPQLTARVTNGVGTARDQYDFSLLTYNDGAKFNLARLDASGVSGIRNVVVEGDLLTSVTAQASSFFSGDSNRAGIRLPSDNLAGVSIRDFAPNGFIQARSIQAMAFGSFLDGNKLQTGANANGEDAEELLTGGTQIVQAADTLRVAFADLPSQQAALFIATDENGRHFDNDSVTFVVQSVATANAAGTANIVTPSNVPRGADTALVTVMPTHDHHGNLEGSVIQTIAIRGDGASIETQQWISQSITSTGPLGDLILLSNQGITDVTASSIFGSIISGGAIIGTIQTTGIRTDPITGATSSVSADFGNLYVSTSNEGPGNEGRWNEGPCLTTTVVETQCGGVSGRIISRGSLVSQITSGGDLSGVIAVQGNLGLNRTVAGQNMRFGGIVSNGPVSGSVVILGQQIADVTINGGLNGGHYAVEGGILGNLLINGGLDALSALVSGGQIGASALGTTLTVNGDNKGIIAAAGNIVFGKHAPKGYVFNQVGTNLQNPNAAALRAIFTNNNLPLALDVSGLDLQGLTLILLDLQSLRVANGTLAGPVP